MSAILDSALDATRRAECFAHDAALAQAMFPTLERPKLRAFIVRIGDRDAPRLEFACMAASSAQALEQHMDLADGERVEIIACTGEFAISAKRHQMEEAMLREVV